MEKCVIPAGDALEVWSQVGAFDAGIAELRRADESRQKPSLELITSEQLAIIRIRGGPASPFSEQGTWVAENYNYGNDRCAEIVIVSADLNPILKQPVEATSAHRQREEFYLDAAAWKRLRDVAESDPYKAMENGALLVTRKALKPEIPVEAFGETPETVFLFREQATNYGNWLKAQGIKTVPQWTADADYAKKQKNAFARALWVHSLGSRSVLNGNPDRRDYDGWVRGVRVVPAERAAPEAPQGAKVVKPTLDEVMTVAGTYCAPINLPALQKAMKELYRQE